jgi:hypothetical protein
VLEIAVGRYFGEIYLTRVFKLWPMQMIWLLWKGDYKMLKKYLLQRSKNKYDGIRIKWKNTKYMTVSLKPYNENGYVKFDTYNFEIVTDCTNLCKILTDKNELRPEIEKRITSANRAYIRNMHFYFY